MGARRDRRVPHSDAIAFASAIKLLTEAVAECHPLSLDAITGRPKRTSAIAKKLARRPTLRLSQMEDVSGLRVRLPDQATVRQVLEHIERHCKGLVKVDDYVARPRATGYRAVHAVVFEHDSRVEIQLRTPGQNRWADTVESWADRLGLNGLGDSLKDGEGPPDLVRYFERAAYRIAVEEAGGQVDESFEADFQQIREEVRHYFEGRR